MEIQAAARSRRMTVAEWVRQSLRKVRRDEPTRPVADKLNAVREAVAYEFPSGNIERLLDEIERGRVAQRDEVK